MGSPGWAAALLVWPLAAPGVVADVTFCWSREAPYLNRMEGALAMVLERVLLTTLPNIIAREIT